MAKKVVRCYCAKWPKHAGGPGFLLTAEGKRVPCPYCHGAKKRFEIIPDPSHRMQRKWHSEILAPAGTARFYSVRSCVACGEREEKAAAGHFFNGLLTPCALEAR